MKNNCRAAALAGILLISPASLSAASTVSGVKWVEDTTTPTVEVNWCDVTAPTDAKRAECYPAAQLPAATSDVGAERKRQSKASRVLAGQVVKVRVTQFNAIIYDLSFTPEYKVIESYVVLDKAFKQLLLGGVLPGGVGVAGQQGITQFTKWEGLQLGASRWATNTMRFWKTKVGEALTDKNLGPEPTVAPPGVGAGGNAENATETLYVLIAKLDVVRRELEAARSTANVAMSSRNAALDADKTGSSDDIAARLSAIEENKKKFRSLDDEHMKVLDALDGLALRATEVRDGTTYFQPHKEAGTQVTILIATKKAGTTENAKTSASINYLVENKYGLEFFGGYMWSKLSDVKFRTVKSLGGDEVFAQVRDESIEDFTVSLGYSIYTFDRPGNYQMFGSIGTDVSDPGDRYYLGLGLLFWERVALVGGYATGIAEEGEDPDTTNPDFFTTVKESREWEPFFGLSIKLYPSQ